MNRWDRLPLVFWVASVIAIVIIAKCGQAGWDYEVYWRAAQAVHRNMDPYALGIAAQRAFHDLPTKYPHAHPPMTYVYPPMTFPLLRAAANLPSTVAESLYFAILMGGFVLQLRAGWQMANVEEQRWLRWLLPAVAFFPGLLNDDVLLSGNIAYLLYGLMLAAAVPGWKNNRWWLYYCAVLFASFFKAPLLCMAALPLFVGRRQQWAAGGTAAAGSLLFCAQAKLWPELFHEYLTAVQLQFDFNSDFGISPSGILGNALVQYGRSYSFATTSLYAVFATAVFLALCWTVRVARDNENMRQHWLPVALVGTVLLNPRIKEYDVAALTIPLILIASRLLRLLVERPASRRDHRSIRREGITLSLLAGGWFIAANCSASGDTWKPIELSILVSAFCLGTWKSIHDARATLSQSLVRQNTVEASHGAKLVIDGYRIS